MVRLNRTYYSLLKITSKIFQIPPVKFQRITQIPRGSPTQSANYVKFAPFDNTTPYVSGTCPGREHCGIPANYANSAQFAHTVRELHKIRTFVNLFYIKFQISDHRQRTQENWSESTRFHSIRPPITRITRIPRILQ